MFVPSSMSVFKMQVLLLKGDESNSGEGLVLLKCLMQLQHKAPYYRLWSVGNVTSPHKPGVRYCRRISGKEDQLGNQENELP